MERCAHLNTNQKRAAVLKSDKTVDFKLSTDTKENIEKWEKGQSIKNDNYKHIYTQQQSPQIHQVKNNRIEGEIDNLKIINTLVLYPQW